MGRLTSSQSMPASPKYRFLPDTWNQNMEFVKEHAHKALYTDTLSGFSPKLNQPRLNQALPWSQRELTRESPQDTAVTATNGGVCPPSLAGKAGRHRVRLSVMGDRKRLGILLVEVSINPSQSPSEEPCK
jgi:hypothetical protein